MNYKFYLFMQNHFIISYIRYYEIYFINLWYVEAHTYGCTTIATVIYVYIIRSVKKHAISKKDLSDLYF